jgi:hypothetical protein
MSRYFILVLLLLTPACHAQAPVEVSPCDLVKHPETYNNKVIQIRDRVLIAFEDFSLDANGCGDRLRSVWLAYGGDEPTPTMSTVNDQSRPTGSVLKVNGKPIFLAHDESLELFKRRLSAVRVGVPGGNLYEVTATFTGYFFEAHKDGGYGHLGCCHLFVIQKVAAVEARRTGVPAGGNFPPETLIGCRNLSSDFAISKTDATNIAKTAGSSSEAWRLVAEQPASRVALDDAARRWNVTLASDLTFDSCSSRMTVAGNQFTWCTWTDPNSMQSFRIQITRFGFLRHFRGWDSVPWILTRGDGVVCTADDK